MADNLVAKFRRNSGLSQRQLAKKIEVSHQTIQRIEGGAPAKMEVARDLARAFGVPLTALFPPPKKPRKKKGEIFEPPAPAKNIDENPSSLTIEVKLKGIEQTFDFMVDGITNDRIWRCLRDYRTKPFIVFRSGLREIALRTKFIQWVHFHFDVFLGREVEEAFTEDDVPGGAVMWMEGEYQPAEFALDMEPSPPCSDDDEEHEHNDMETIFFLLDSLIDEDDAQMQHFTDVDGEDVVFNPESLILLDVAAWYVDQKLYEALLDDDEMFDEDDVDDAEAEPEPVVPPMPVSAGPTTIQ